ncbi:MAG TPA: MraY family glycosyltransferase [Rhodocyclaceae bacterium]|nr:MraY family glycosyltransferase [Rhodocyclaceae bacterium]
MFSLALFLLGTVVSAVAIRYGIVAAHHFGVVDKPGGHKAHDTVTPFVGGIGVVCAFMCAVGVVASGSNGFPFRLDAMAAGVLIMFITGFADDLLNLHYRIRLCIQAMVGVIMIFGGGVVLRDFGHVGSASVVSLGYVGIPLTLIATIGAINALNMIDGIDGLSGSISLVSLVLIALALHHSGNIAYFSLVMIIAGGVAGFLIYNLRYPGHRRARCFLGDNGSMVLGYAFAWLLSDLCQETKGVRVITPVTTLWLFAVPLIDTLCVMMRRVWMGGSPFRADRYHLHHLFQRAGFRVQDTVFILASVQLFFGAVGLAGMYAGISEIVMLAAFGVLFGLCFLVILRPWRFVPALRRVHRLLGLTSVQAVGVYVGGLTETGLMTFSKALKRDFANLYDFQFSVYRQLDDITEEERSFGVVELLTEDKALIPLQIGHIKGTLKREFQGSEGLVVREFVARNAGNDRRSAEKGRPAERRSRDRRSQRKPQALLRTVCEAGDVNLLSISKG